MKITEYYSGISSMAFSPKLDCLNVVVFYKRYHDGRNAVQLYERCVRPYLPVSRSHFDIWRLDLFDRDPSLVELARDQVVQTDILVLAFREDEEITGVLLDQLDDWLEMRQKKEIALIALNPPAPGLVRLNKAVRLGQKRLKELAAIPGVELFTKQNVEDCELLQQ